MKRTKRKQIEPTEMDGELYIGKAEVGRRLGIKPRTIDAWMKEGRLVFYKIGRAVRFRYSEVQTHLAKTCRVVPGEPTIK